MSGDIPTTGIPGPVGSAMALQLKHELHHVRSHWWWLLLLGVLLVVCGTGAIISPPLTVLTTAVVTEILGVLLMVGGIATIVGAFWIGRWSALLLQVLVGLVYLGCGFVVVERPEASALIFTVFIAVSFIMMGTFRVVASLMLRFPQWGWALLNGVITLLAGLIIWRQLPGAELWVIGLLVGIEMLFNGWTWIMLALAVRQIPTESK